VQWIDELAPNFDQMDVTKLHDCIQQTLNQPEMMREKNLFMYWADNGHNAPVVSAKMEKLLWILSSFLLLVSEVAAGDEEKRRHF
jgi:hypothetical protein